MCSSAKAITLCFLLFLIPPVVTDEWNKIYLYAAKKAYRVIIQMLEDIRQSEERTRCLLQNPLRTQKIIHSGFRERPYKFDIPKERGFTAKERLAAREHYERLIKLSEQLQRMN